MAAFDLTVYLGSLFLLKQKQGRYMAKKKNSIGMGALFLLLPRREAMKAYHDKRQRNPNNATSNKMRATSRPKKTPFKGRENPFLLLPRNE
jgi:hypothetical protein